MAVNANLLLLQVLNGLALGILYLLIASGLSVIFGMTDIINFAHGALYTLGAYFGLTLIGVGGNFWVALVVAPLLVGVFGAIVERSTLHRIYDRDPLYHIILTFGLVLMITEAVEFIWGKQPKSFDIPGVLTGAMTIGPIIYPKYKLFLIAAGVVVTALLWALFEFTEFGLIIRASAQDAGGVRLMGIETSRYFTVVFALAATLAGVAGVLAGPFLNVIPSMGEQIIIIAFIVVIVGGLGSFRGSVVAALLIGLVQTLGQVFAPQLTGFTVFLLMIAVLLLRPEGIFGEYAVREEATKIEFAERIDPVGLDDRRVLAVLGVLAVLPLGIGLVYSSFFVSLLSLMFIWALFALSLDLVMGYMGLLSFGHAAFWGVGGYVAALTAVHVSPSFLIAFGVAVAVSAAVAWVIGALSIRLSGVYFAMITLAFAEMFHSASISFDDITGGSDGLGMPALQFLGLNLGDTVTFYYFTLVLVAGIYGLTVYLLDTPFGRVMTAIRESERRLSFLGYDTNKYKRRAFTLSGAIGGVAGTLFAAHNTFVSPSALHWTVSGDVVIAMMFGGMGTLFGPMVGAVVFVGMSELVSSYLAQWRFVLGLLLVLVVMFAPRGLVTVHRSVLGRVDLPVGPTTPEDGEVDVETTPPGGEDR